MPGSDDFELSGVSETHDRIVRQVLLAGANAVRTTTREVEKDIEAVIRAAVGGKLWRAVASEAYPRRGAARDPVGEIYVNGGTRTKGAYQFFTRPGRIRNADDFYLAIPLPAAGVRGRNRNLTPKEWLQRNPGRKLRFVYRHGKSSLLVATGGTTNGRTGAFRQLTGGKRGRIAQGRGGSNPLYDSVVPIFVLIHSVPFANSANTGRVIEEMPSILASNFGAELRNLAGR
ncbi:MAG: DUF6441 family protein [Sphingobium sp.]